MARGEVRVAGIRSKLCNCGDGMGDIDMLFLWYNQHVVVVASAVPLSSFCKVEVHCRCICIRIIPII